MRNAMILAAMIAGTPNLAAQAQTIQPLPPADSACENTVVCATMKNGRSVAISDCKAREDGVVHFLYGDCQDED